MAILGIPPFFTLAVYEIEFSDICVSFIGTASTSNSRQLFVTDISNKVSNRRRSAKKNFYFNITYFKIL